MNNLRRFKQKLSLVSRLWDQADYDAALAEIETLIHDWPGNAHLRVLWASLVQLQEDPTHDLSEVKLALQTAIDLDRTSPAAAIELGHYLDSVDDDPQAAARAYAEGVIAARQLLMDGLIGQARVFRQLNRKEDFRRCLEEILYLARFEMGPRKGKTESDPYAEQIQDLLSDLTASRSA